MHSAEVHATLVEQPRGAAETHLNCDVEGCDAKIASGQLMGGHLPHRCGDFDLRDACADPNGRGRRSWPRCSPATYARAAVCGVVARAGSGGSLPTATRPRRPGSPAGATWTCPPRVRRSLFPAARTPGSRGVARPRIKFTGVAYTTPPAAQYYAHTDTRPGALRTGLHSSPPYIP
jgi:hypothetical protein